MLVGVVNLIKLYAGQDARPDLEAFFSSGLLEECIGAVVAFEAGGVQGLGDVHHGIM